MRRELMHRVSKSVSFVSEDGWVSQVSRKWDWSRRTFALVVILVGIGGLISSCRPEMTEFPGRYSIDNPEDDSQIIVEAVILAAGTPDGTFHQARYDDRLVVRRYAVQARVVTDIHGGLSPGSSFVFYYFLDSENIGGSREPMQFRVGERFVLFLERDYGALRTICDQWLDCCAIHVYSGAHTGLKIEYPEGYSGFIARILVTRGGGADDPAMFKAVRKLANCRACTPSAQIGALEMVSRQETGIVKEEACRQLAFMKHPCESNLEK